MAQQYEPATRAETTGEIPATRAVAPEARVPVIVVEDDPATILFYGDVLTEAGYEVTICESGLGVVPEVRRRHPRVVVLDLGLPYGSGIRVLHALKGEPATVAVPVVVVSAMVHLLPRAVQALAAAVLAKPFELDDLLTLIRQYGT
jgi:DNA-binding response OmpR family regulator